MTGFCYGAVEEQEIMIGLQDGKRIKGILRGDYNNPMVVVVHGRPGGANDTKHFLFARYLYEAGISSLRLFLYDYDENTRNLVDINSVKTHSRDVDEVIRYVKNKGTKKIVIVGHSYGGLTAMFLGQSIDGVVLWEPSHGLAWQEQSIRKYEDFGKDIMIDKLGRGYVVSRKMHEADLKLKDTTELISGINTKLLLVGAEKGVLLKHVRSYYDAAEVQKKLIILKNATHGLLDSDKVMIDLFSQTTNWIKEAYAEA